MDEEDSVDSSAIIVERFTFVPSVEQHLDAPDDMVLHVPMTLRTGQGIVRFFQEQFAVHPWSWRQGGWNNLNEALEDGFDPARNRLVLKHQGLPRHLSEDDRRTYLEMLSNYIAALGKQGHPGRLAVLFPDQVRPETERLAAYGRSPWR